MGAGSGLDRAIGGYDAVAYFEEGTATRGDPSHTVQHAGLAWLFATDAHARAFEASPEAYSPAYGGQCSFATSLGKTETGDPTKWVIKSGRLFFNSNAVAHALWKIIPGRVSAADRNWSSQSASM